MQHQQIANAHAMILLDGNTIAKKMNKEMAKEKKNANSEKLSTRIHHVFFFFKSFNSQLMLTK